MITLIAAMSRNRVIGINNTLPRHIPEDLMRFKQLTKGHSIVMGKNTFLSIGKLLPQRENIIISTSLTHSDIPMSKHATYTLLRSIDDRKQRYEQKKDNHIYIVWWAKLYTQFLDVADSIELSLIDEEIDGDSFFPEFEDKFTETHREICITQQKSTLSFITYTRKNA
jgi:dihydrofolate reductase